LHLPQGGGDLRLAAQGKGPTAGGRCGQKGNCVGDIVGVGVPGTGHGGTHCGPMHRHTVPLPSSASAPLADRSSHSHAATTSRTAATVRAVPRGPRRVGCRDDVAGEGVSDYLTPAAGLHIRAACRACT
uniref:Uncharacterized protein n=1 Tax=Aegilops tauschii subsp. strangulata TaxID=200361 RepID=A0A452XTJ9_AEGTS